MRPIFPETLRVAGRTGALALLLFLLASCQTPPAPMKTPELSERAKRYELNHQTPVSPPLQAKLEEIDARLRARHRVPPGRTAVGLLDLQSLQLAMIHPDRAEYAASVAKLGILLAWFHARPEAAAHPPAEARRDMELMVKVSDNRAATRLSRSLGLPGIQQSLNAHGLHDPARGGGLWMGRHYDGSGEQYRDPVSGHSHAATVRETLRFYLLLEQDRLVSPQASRTMREIFKAPALPHDDRAFVRALKHRPVEIRRKWGHWREWHHDTAVVSGPGRYYILVAFTRHPAGDAYLADLARAVDDLMLSQARALP